MDKSSSEKSLASRASQTTFPAAEHDQFIAHFRGLLRHWVEAEGAG